MRAPSAVRRPPVEVRRAGIAVHICARYGAPRPPATVAAQRPLARRRDPRSSVSGGNPPTARRQPERAPHSPTSASAAARRAHRARGRLRCEPTGGTHRGGMGTPLEGTYFQAEPGNAICVQSLDDSLNSAIHITYHISLRSSSLREPRYPSTGVVVWVVVSARTHTDPAKRSRARTRAVGWGGALQTAVGADRQGGSFRSTRAFPFT